VNFEKILAVIDAMNREGVEYITFGAVALAAHGCVRATTDADFFVKPDPENIERLKRALRTVWDDPHIDEISADDLLGDYPSVMYGPPEEKFSLDFLTRLGEAYAYDNLPWEIVPFGGRTIRVVTAAKLYEMKRNTVRPKDKMDCIALNEKFEFEKN
jgi:hypothetical protein